MSITSGKITPAWNYRYYCGVRVGGEVECWGGDLGSTLWLDALARLPVPVPAPAPPRCPERLPPEFWKHFWSGTDPADIRLPADGEAVAAVLIYDEPCTLAKSWALRNLPTGALQSTLRLRGLSESGGSSIRAELARRGGCGGS